MTKLLLIDGNSILNRAFYATPALTNKDGIYTNAVFGFVNMLIKAIGDIRPTHIMCAFDMKAKTFRHKLYSGYKASRKGMPDELASQMPLIHDLLGRMNICICEREGIEADDIIGTCAKSFDVETIILTGDRDSFQLVDKTTKVFLTKKGISDVEIVDEISIGEIYGLTPSQVIDYKSLRGDTSDEIPGVKGVGDKTAMTLISKYGCLDGVYEHIDEISGKLREKLEEGRETAYLSRTLATIVTDCELGLKLDDMLFSYPFSKKVFEFFAEYDMKSFLKKKSIFDFDIASSQSVTPDVKDEKEGQRGVGIDDKKVLANVEGVVSKVKIEIISDADALNALVCRLKTAKRLAFEYDDSIHVFADGDDTEYYVQFSKMLLDDLVKEDQAVKIFAPLLESETVGKVVFDSKLLRCKLDEFDLRLAGVVEDVSLKKYLCDKSQDPKTLAIALDSRDLDKTTVARSLLLLSDIIETEIAGSDVEKLYREIELPLAFLLYKMEREGFMVDRNMLEEFSVKYEQELRMIESEIYSLAGESFNLNSTKQLSYILFEKLGLKGKKKNKSGYSTDIDVLESLEGESPIISKIIRYRKIAKLKSTYVDGMLGLIDAKSGLIHTSFRQTITTTGRLSSVEPNLQNIPVRSEDGKELRKVFIPRSADRVLISADYSQIELRLMAHLSGDENLVNAFLSSADVHSSTASKVFGVDISDVTSEMRRKSKAVNFGIIYGISDFGLAKQTGNTVREAKEFINKYFMTYPKVAEFMEKCGTIAKEKGYAETMFGRQRRIPELYSSNYSVRSFGIRAAMNMPLQGAAADIIKMAMLKVDEAMRREGLSSKLILQIHDELIVDALVEEESTVVGILRNEMENVVKLKVPLIVNVAVGKNWYDTK